MNKQNPPVLQQYSSSIDFNTDSNNNSNTIEESGLKQKFTNIFTKYTQISRLCVIIHMLNKIRFFHYLSRVYRVTNSRLLTVTNDSPIPYFFSHFFIFFSFFFHH